MSKDDIIKLGNELNEIHKEYVESNFSKKYRDKFLEACNDYSVKFNNYIKRNPGDLSDFL